METDDGRELRELTASFSKGIPPANVFGFLFENARDAICVLDERGNFVAVNRRLEELTGFKRENYTGKSFREIVPAKSLPETVRSFLNVIQGKSARLELELKTATRKTVLVEVTSARLIKDGKNVWVIGVARDISEHKQADRALQKSEEMFETLMEEAPIGICNADLKGKITYVNKRFEEAIGYSREEVVGKNGFRLGIMSDETLKLFAERMKERLIGKPNRPLEGRFKRKDGEWIWAETEGRVIKKFGVPVGFQLIAKDITERKRAEEERKRFEESLSALNIYSGKINAASSFDQVYELTMEAMEKTLGFEHAAFMNVDKGNLRIASYRGYPEPLSLRLPLDGSRKGVTVRAATTRKPMLVHDVTKDKDYIEGAPSIRSELAVPVEMENTLVGVLDVESRKLEAFNERDVMLLQILASHAATAISNLEKRREIEMRSSQLASLMKSSAEMISTTELRKRLGKIAEAIREMGWRRVVLYVTDENLEMRSPEDLVSAGITNEERGFLWKKRQRGEVWRERFGPKYERFRIGVFFYLPWSDPLVRKSFSEDNVPSKLPMEEMVDWDPQDLLIAPLRLADGRFVGMISIDDPLDGRRPTRESLAPLELFIHQAAVAIENAQLFLQLNEAKNEVKEYADQLELKVKQRTHELVEAQNRLLKSERLAAIGEIAAMVGHDLRNPLAGIDGAAYYLRIKFGQNLDQRAKEMFELIERNIDYSNNIITDLLEYSREIRLEIGVADPKSIVGEALSFARVPPNIEVTDLTTNEPKMEVDSERMKRVFVNIIKNAVDAMPEGGKLTVESKESDGNLEIAITDTGTGMSKETLGKLWTPLFTTKAKGMGLGLSICKRFVEAHGGRISVKSKEGKGTTFTVTVPVRSRLEGGESNWMNPSESLLSTTMKA